MSVCIEFTAGLPKTHLWATPPQIMPTLLITGGAGFIGSYTAEIALKQGWNVRVLDDLSTGLPKKALRLEELGAKVKLTRKDFLPLTIDGSDNLVPKKIEIEKRKVNLLTECFNSKQKILTGQADILVSKKKDFV